MIVSEYESYMSVVSIEFPLSLCLLSVGRR